MGNPLDRLVTEQARVNPLDALVTAPAQEERTEFQIPLGPNMPVIKGTLPSSVDPYIAPWAEMGNTVLNAVRQAPGAIADALQIWGTENASPEIIAKRAQTVQAMGGVFGAAKRTFDALIATPAAAMGGDPAAKVAIGQWTMRTAGRITDAWSQAQASPATITSIPPMLVSGIAPLVTAPLEAVSGHAVGRESDVLTAEEQTHAMLMTAANFAAMYAGGRIAAMLEDAATPAVFKVAAAEGVTNAQTMQAANGELVSNLARLGRQGASRTRLSLLKDHAITGLGGGVAFGAVEALGEDDMLDRAITYGIVGTALGTFMGAFQTKPIYQDRLALIASAQRQSYNHTLNAARAEFLGKARMLNLFETQNFNDVIGATSALNTSSALARAVVTKQLSTPNRFVLERIDAESADFVLKAMANNDFQRLVTQGMSAEHAMDVTGINRTFHEQSTKPTQTFVNVGPINELNVNKLLAKVRAQGLDATARLLRSSLGESVFNDIQYHATPNIIEGEFIPSELGLHFGTQSSANQKIGYLNLVSREDLSRALQSHKFMYIKDMIRDYSKRTQSTAYSLLMQQKTADAAISKLSDTQVANLNKFISEQWVKNLKAQTDGRDQVFPFFAIVKNPLELPDVGNFNSGAVLEQLRKKGILTLEEDNATWNQRTQNIAEFKANNPNPGYDSPDYPIYRAREKAAEAKAFIELLESKGYDGIKYTNAHEDPGSISGTVFRPDTQLMKLDEILKHMNVEGQSPQYKSVMDLREIYDFYPNEMNAKSQIPSAIVRARGDGTFDVAFSWGVEDFSPVERRHFVNTGYMQGQPVNYNGKAAILKNVSPGSALAEIEVVMGSGEHTTIGTRTVPIDEITIRAEPVARARILATDAIYQDFVTKSFRAEPTTVNNSKLVQSIPAKNYKLPKEHSKSNPRYGKNTLQFESEFDKAVYMAFSSKAEAGKNPKALELRKHVRETTGFTDTEMRDHREAVLHTLKGLAEANESKLIKLPRVVTMLENVQRLIPVREVSTKIPAEGQSWNALVTKYANENGFSETDIPDLSRQLSGRFFKGNVEATMSEHEAGVFKQHQKVLDDTLINTTQPLRDLNWLDNTLRTRGQYIEHHSGAIVVRDILTGRELYRGRDIPSTVQMMQKAGATEGIAGDGGNNGIGVPPVDAIPPSGNSGQSPFVRHDTDNWASRLRATADHFRSITKADAFFINLEKTYGGELYQNLFYKLREATDRYTADYTRWLKTLTNDLEQKYNLSADERLLAGELQETYSANDIRTKGFYNNRPATAIEDTLGTELGSNPAIDITKVANYITILDFTYKHNKENFLPRMEKAKVDLQMNGDELAFVERFKREGQTNELSNGTIYALAQAVRGDVMGTPFLSRTEFIEKFKVPKKIQQFVDESTKMDKDLANEFGLPEEFRINPYMTHKRTYGTADYNNFVDTMNPNEEAYFRLHRTGLLKEYERDPIYAKSAYIRAGLAEKHLTPEVKRINAFLADPATEKLLGADYKYVKTRVEGMVNDIRGIPDESTIAFNNKAHKYFEAIGLGDDVRRIISVTNGWVDAAFQGGAARAGFRDVLSGMMKTSMNMKWTDGAEMVRRGSKEAWKRMRNEPNAITDLMDRGIIKKQTLSGLESVDQAGASFSNTKSSGLIRGAEKIGRLGLISSGQPTIHETLQAGLYLHVWERAAESVKAFKEGRIGTEEFSRINQVSAYDKPVTDHFNKLIAADKRAEAADYLAREAIAINLGRYGQGNNPYLWTSWWGRLMGQYGQYAADHKTFVLRGLSNGSFGDRAAFASKYALANATLIGLGYYTATNIGSRLAPITGLAFGGGPAFSIVTGIRDVLSGNNGYNTGINYFLDMAPYNQHGWNLNHAHAWLPFSSAVNDYYHAIDMIANDEGTGFQQGIRALGIKPDQPTQ